MNVSREIISESVSRGHPDKLCDQISDAVLDACLKIDSEAKVACECLIKDDHIILAGEIGASVDIKQINLRQVVSQVLNDVGYNEKVFGSAKNALRYAGICANNFKFTDLLGQQSIDIAKAVEKPDETIGAGDQGMVYGYACQDTPSLMPAPIYYCQKMMRLYDEVVHRHDGLLRPDAKCQLTFQYHQGKPDKIINITLSAHHSPEANDEQLKSFIVEQIITPVLPSDLLSEEVAQDLEQPRGNTKQLFINPSGKFEIGGPKGDAGLTGRKIIVDSYGGMARHGGGAFSGKDPTKIDRSAAYFARYLAKNLVKIGYYNRCEVMIGYAIGVSKPVAFNIDGELTEAGKEAGKQANTDFNQWIYEKLSFSPESIIQKLMLRRPIFSPTARYGHFGHEDLGFTWEKNDLGDQLAL